MNRRAPFQVGDRVAVVASAEPRGALGVHRFIGRSGVVERLDYNGFGQSYPRDPMIGVTFTDGTEWAFWREELARRGGK